MTVAVDTVPEDLVPDRGNSQHVAHSRWSRSNETGATGADRQQVAAIQSKWRTFRLEAARVRTFKSAEHLARAAQLAWKIAEVAADPVAVEPMSPR